MFVVLKVNLNTFPFPTLTCCLQRQYRCKKDVAFYENYNVRQELCNYFQKAMFSKVVQTGSARISRYIEQVKMCYIYWEQDASCSFLICLHPPVSTKSEIMILLFTGHIY